jgi:hypothetical protein
MNWRGGLIVLAAGIALVVGTVLGVLNGHNGTPAVTVLVSPSGSSAVKTAAPFEACPLDSTGSAQGGSVHVSGACTGALLGKASCGDATGSVALALQTTAGPQRTFSLIVQFDNDPIGAGRQPASLFAEVDGPRGFFRWSDRSTSLSVTKTGQIELTGVRLPAEAGTNSGPMRLSGSTYCDKSS